VSNFFSKLFKSFNKWLKQHTKEEVEEIEYPSLLDLMLSREEITKEEYLEYFEHEKTTYEKRIIRYMEKHPNATLKEARGHG